MHIHTHISIVAQTIRHTYKKALDYALNTQQGKYLITGLSECKLTTCLQKVLYYNKMQQVVIHAHASLSNCGSYTW